MCVHEVHGTLAAMAEFFFYLHTIARKVPWNRPR
jgi:hypothetical protein